MRFLVIFLLIMCGAVLASQAQSREEKKTGKTGSQENSYSPYQDDGAFKDAEKDVSKKHKHKHKLSFRQLFTRDLDRKKEEFYDRLKKNAKEDRKIARKMEKPQYSDPMYFGHKHKPKKRPVGKRKFCKECGIVH